MDPYPTSHIDRTQSGSMKFKEVWCYPYNNFKFQTRRHEIQGNICYQYPYCSNWNWMLSIITQISGPVTWHPSIFDVIHKNWNCRAGDLKLKYLLLSTITEISGPETWHPSIFDVIHKNWNFRAGDLKFKYVEEEEPEDFFLPYIWNLTTDYL